MYKRSLLIHEEQLGTDHPDTAISLGNLANLELALGYYQTAEQKLHRALGIFNNAVGKDHPYTQETIRRLQKLVQQAIQMGQRGQLSENPRTQNILAAIDPGEL